MGCYELSIFQAASRVKISRDSCCTKRVTRDLLRKSGMLRTAPYHPEDIVSGHWSLG